MTHLGPTPIRPVIEYEPRGVEVPEGMRVVGWVNRHLVGLAVGTRDHVTIWPNECFHAQVPVMVPVEEE